MPSIALLRFFVFFFVCFLSASSHAPSSGPACAISGFGAGAGAGGLVLADPASYSSCPKSSYSLVAIVSKFGLKSSLWVQHSLMSDLISGGTANFSSFTP